MQSILVMLKAILEAMIRLEKKLDEVLRVTVNPNKGNVAANLPTMLMPLSNPGQPPCPLCQRPVTYQKLRLPDLEIVLRTCGCEPQVTQLPTPQGVPNDLNSAS